MASPRTTEAPLRGSTGQLFDLQPAAAGRRSRVPELALGVLLIVGGALGALLWQINATRTTAVIAAGTDIRQGDVIELEDLQLVEIRSENTLNVLGANSSEIVVGRVARTDLAPGTLLTAQHVVDGTTIAAGEGIVGLELTIGQVPSLRLRPGELVDVVLTPADSDELDAELSAAPENGGSRVLVEGVIVEEFLSLEGGRVFVGLRMDEDAAALTTRAGSLGRVNLVAVSGGGS